MSKRAKFPILKDKPDNKNNTINNIYIQIGVVSFNNLPSEWIGKIENDDIWNCENQKYKLKDK